MRSKKSHGWLSLSVIIGFVIIVGAAIGIYSSAKNRLIEGQSIAQERGKALELQSRLLADNFLRTVESIREQAVKLRELRSLTLSRSEGPSGNLIFWAEARVRDEQIKAVTQFAHNPASLARSPDIKFIDYLAKRLNLSELRKNGISMLRVKQDPHGLSEWLVFGFMVPAVSDSLVLAWIDPKEAFSFVSDVRAYLIGGDGLVLAHSQPSYAAVSFSSTKVFSNGIIKTFKDGLSHSSLSQSLSQSQSFRAIDQRDVLFAATRLGSLPLVAVIEQPVQPGAMLQDGLRDNLKWWGLWFLGLILFCAFVWSRYARNDDDQLDLLNAVPRIEISDSAEVLEALETFGEAQALKQEVASDRATSMQILKTAQSESKLMGEFEERASTARDPKQAALEMTRLAAELCKSPVLFFVYRQEISAALLQADAGFLSGASPASMSFSVSQELLAQIEETAKKGEIPFLSAYEPLADILLSRTGIAHFEAWAVTGYGPLGRQAGRARLLGILVILQAGVDSVVHQDSLKRMMRQTGLIYENALLSR